MTDNDEEILNHALQTFVENLTNSIKKGLVLVEGKIATGSVDMFAYTCTVNIETNTLAFINIAPDNKPQTDKSTKLDAGHISFSNVPLETLINLEGKNYRDNTVTAALALDKRLEIMNKFRESMKDQSATFITRTEYSSLHDRVIEDIRILRESKASLFRCSSSRTSKWNKRMVDRWQAT